MDVRCRSGWGDVLRWALLAGSCAALAGCGAEEYEERLKHTREMFKHEQTLDAELSRPAQVGGVSIRVPQEYAPLPPPPPPEKDSEGKPIVPEEGIKDPRQPEWFPAGVTLPGLAGAWKTEIPTDGEPRLAWIYVLSNYDLWRTDLDLAKEFHAKVQEAVIAGINQPTSTTLNWMVETVPPKEQKAFAERISYQTVTPPAFSIDDTPYLMSVYLFNPRSGGKDNQGAILYIRPQNADSELRNTTIQHMLETVDMVSGKPSGGGGGGGGTGGGTQAF